MKKLWIVIALAAILGITYVAACDAKRKKAEPPKTNAGMLEKKEALETVATEPDYFEGVKGYYAAPKTAGDYPGVVMIHEWWGLNDHIKQTARQLAGEGYRVLAVNLHETEPATTPEKARELTGKLDQARALANMKAAAAYLRAQGATRVASLGWCFGGGQSLQLSLSGEPLDATVIYYGQLVTEAEALKKLPAPVLGVFGEADQSVKVESARAFDAALDAAGIENEVVIYPGVGHAFANPSGANYAPEPTKDAWEKTLTFLSAHLK